MRSPVDPVSFCLRCQILDEIAERGIKIYQLPDADSDEDEEFKEQTRVLKVCVEDTVTTHTSLEPDSSLPSLSFIPLPSIYPPLPAFSPIAAHWFLSFPFQASIPFAVIGSNQLIEVKGKKIRGRLYPWGVVEVENPEHNDFLKLRTMLVWVSADSKVLKWLKGFERENGQKSNSCQFETFAANLYCLLVCKGRNCRCRTHMQDLQEVTQDLHYENFRSERLKRACR